MAQYNSAFDLGFEVLHDCEDPNDIPAEDLLNALQKRVDQLRANPEEVKDACGCFDTMDEED